MKSVMRSHSKQNMSHKVGALQKLLLKNTLFQLHSVTVKLKPAPISMVSELKIIAVSVLQVEFSLSLSLTHSG